MLADTLRRVKTQPGIKVDVGSFVKLSGTGNQDISIPRNLVSAPAGSWAIIFWSVGSVAASGVWGAHTSPMIGFTTGPANSFSTGGSSDDAANPSNSARRMSAKCICFPNSNTGDAHAEADFVSFPTASTMRLNWTASPAAAFVINFMIISGLTGAKVVNWTTPATAIDQAVTGVGFSPDLVLNAQSVVSGALPIGALNMIFGIGMFNKHGQQWGDGIVSNDASAPANTSRWQQTDAGVVHVSQNEVEGTQMHFVKMDADGFTLRAATALAQRNIISLCLKGLSSKIGAFVTSSGASQVVDTRAKFHPRGALFGGYKDIPTTLPLAHSILDVGFTDFANHRAAISSDKDAVTPSVVKSAWFSDAPLVVGWDSAVSHKATMVTNDQGVLTLTASPAAAGFEVPYLLLGDAGVDTFPTKVAV